MNEEILYSQPEWLIGLITLVLLIISVEVGYQEQVTNKRKPGNDKPNYNQCAAFDAKLWLLPPYYHLTP